MNEEQELLSPRYARMIALGRSCQCPHQVRRATRNKSASYFDWLGTPLPGLLAILQRGFEGCFEREDLHISPDRTTVHHRQFGLSYRHLFSRLPNTELIDPEALDSEYEEKREKMDMLAQRWVESIVTEPTLFVRHDTMSFAEAKLLYDELARQAGPNRAELLVVLPPGEQWTCHHRGIYVESGAPMSEPGNWTGDDQIWDRVLERYWSGHKDAPASKAARANISAAAAGPLVIFQVPNEIGLGHMNRAGCVATAMRELDPGVRSLFVVEGSSHGVVEGMGHPVVSLPAPQAMRDTNGWAQWTKEGRGALVNSLADALVESLAPNLVVYDCFPSGAFVRAAARRAIPSVLCLRKVKDWNIYMERSAVKLVLHDCETILVPHEEQDADLPEILLPRAVFVGPIVKPLPIEPVPVQVRLGLGGRRALVITAGGGGHPDTMAFLELALAGAARLRQQWPDLVTLLIPGPLFQAWEQLPAAEGTRVLPYDPRFTETCATADLVFAQAGYNSANELALLGTPTIMVPAVRGFDDQFERAAQLASQWPHIRYLREPSVTELVELAEELLLNPKPRVRADSPDGAYLAAAHLLHMLGRL